MNKTDEFVSYVTDLTNRSSSYSRLLIKADFWVVIKVDGVFFMCMTGKSVMANDEVVYRGNRAECVNYIRGLK